MKNLPRLVLALLLTIILPLSGCWDRTEAEKLALVIGAAIDRLPDGQILLLCQTVDQSTRQMAGQPGERVNSNTSYHNWSASGSTLFDAIRRLTLSAPHRFYWPHCRVIVISERLARHNIVSVLDFLERDAEIKRSLWLFIARDTPENIFAAGTYNNLPPASLLAESVNTRQRNSWYAVARLNDFIRQLSTPGREAHTAGVDSVAGLMHRDVQAAGSGPTLRELRISHTALFRGGRLVGWLNDRQSRGLLWMLGEVREGIVPVALSEKMISFEVVGSQSSIKPSITNGELKIKISVKVDANIGEVSPGLNTINSGVIKQMEGALAHHVREDIAGALSVMQALGSDAAGLGEAVYRRYPTEWREMYAENWPTIFSSLACEVDVQGRVRSLGRFSSSLKPL
ncbi:Ger(x)C family spore germination protein [Desulfurispora thermophila]|uniref:Ger(x)C family spore germination protein n=1 Tax=Desulfurispora thermophila TaxID=265470 RepID=UPI00035C5EA8|nr:Ger(x)C family spore germination protein [Desulfurispora thermophila]